jgi:serine/threonine protein kinase
MIGLHLSHYRIDAELGRGGMGIVYRALDVTLDRTVALKVLPAAALASKDDRARFYREAKAAARLHHSNIATVFQIDEAVPSEPGQDPAPGAEKRLFIAMEYVEGKPLREHTTDAPLQLEQVVSIATEIARALKAAHAKEIVHRDIKSANVMLTPDGVAKVLDFGLAKTNESTMLTQMGSTLGTVAYMSPEQARGEEVDGRSDLYSLGVVIYEMVAGRLPFAGEYEQAVVYAILNSDPEPLTALRTGVPMAMEDIVAKCLAKDRDLRYPSADALLVDLKRVDVTSGSSRSRVAADHLPESPAAKTGNIVRFWPWLGMAAMVVLGLAIGMSLGPDQPPAALEKLTLHIDGVRDLYSPSVAPGGEYLAFSGTDTTGWQGIFLYDIGEGTTAKIDRSDDGFYPWFSPSGDRLVYSQDDPTRGHPAGIYLVDIPSGVPRLILEDANAATWEDEDHILHAGIGDDGGVGRYTISENLSEPLLEGGATETWIFPGPVMPGTNVLLANTQTEGVLDNDPQLITIDLATGQETVGEKGIINPQGLPGGFLLYQYADDYGPLVARRFDARAGTFLSAPLEITPTMFFAAFHAGIDGSLLMAPDMAQALTLPQQLFLVDVERRIVRSFSLPEKRERSIDFVSISPDGGSALLSSASNRLGTTHVLRVDLATGAAAQQTVDMQIADATWGASGAYFYASYGVENKEGEEGEVLGRQRLTGDGRVDTVSTWMPSIGAAIESQYGLVASATLADGSRSVGMVDSQTGTFGPLPNMTGQSMSPAVSPSGEFVAYLRATGESWRLVVRSLETGEQTELLVDADDIQWSREGDYIYYFTLDGLYRIQVASRGDFRVLGEPEFVFRTDYDTAYSVGPGGTVLLVSSGISFSMQRKSYSRLVWWKNYSAELNKILPQP